MDLDNKRILVAGDVLGKFTKFYQRIKNVCEKAGQFHFVLCVGSFFSLDDENSEDHNLKYIARDFKDFVKIPIYVLGPVCESQKKFYKPLFDQDLLRVPSFEEGFDLAFNVTYLGKKGLLTTVDDLKIAYLSGFESFQSTDFQFDLQDVEDLIQRCSSSRIDILMTTIYPQKVNEFSFGGKSQYLKTLNDYGSILVSKLAKSILPRYHFAASQDQFFEREPYRNHTVMQEQPKLVTRFISIASVENNKKEKWLYAFNIKPAKLLTKDELVKQPDDTTENPYLQLDFNGITKVKKEVETFDNSSYFFDMKNVQKMENKRNTNFSEGSSSAASSLVNGSSNNYPNNENKIRNPMKQNKRSSSQASEEDKRPRFENSCWFCLSSPQAEKHLIISIGDHSYLALDKGRLVDRHFLILPIGHHRSIVEIENNPSLSDVAKEIGKFKNAIIDFFSSKQEVAVFFERNFKCGHLQLQAVAVPKSRVLNIKRVLENECERHRLKLNEIPNRSSLQNEIQEKVPYFYIEFQGKRFFIGIKPSRGFPMQFARELLAHEDILDCPGKIEWRSCELEVNKAKHLVAEIREEFKQFDFTI